MDFSCLFKIEQLICWLRGDRGWAGQLHCWHQPPGEQATQARVQGWSIANQQCLMYPHNIWTLIYMCVYVCLAYVPRYAFSQHRWSWSLDITLLWPDGTCAATSWHHCADPSPCVFSSTWGLSCFSLWWFCHLSGKICCQKKNMF